MIMRTRHPSIHWLYQSCCFSRATKMVKDPTHPAHGLGSVTVESSVGLADYAKARLFNCNSFPKNTEQLITSPLFYNPMYKMYTVIIPM